MKVIIKVHSYMKTKIPAEINKMAKSNLNNHWSIGMRAMKIFHNS